MSIYTKKGDGGETDLLGTGRRCTKDSKIFQVIGAIDELNSYLGITVSESEDRNIADNLEMIQNNLLKIGSILAGANLRFSSSQTMKLEKEIDEMEKKLPSLKNFIIPGGNKIGAKLHYARSLTRKAERNVVGYNQTEFVKPQILTYLNRLSDYLFTLARYSNFKSGEKDRVWKRKK